MKKILTLAAISCVMFGLASCALAYDGHYVPLVNGFPQVIPNVPTNTFAGFFNFLVKMIIGLTGILAVLMIVLGGIQYVSTDSWNDKDSGKKRIQAAVGGLVLALSSYLILNTIDPSLTYVNFTSSLDSTPIESGNTDLFAMSEGPTIDSVGPIYEDGYQGDASVVPIGSVAANNDLIQNPDGTYSITPSWTGLDTDGRTDPGIDQGRTADGRPQHQSTTSYAPNGHYLDATVDNYVVVPIGSRIPNGTMVTVTDHTTGREITAVVGDRGDRYGELSLHAAKELGAWTDGMGNSIKSHNITYTFHTTK